MSLLGDVSRLSGTPSSVVPKIESPTTCTDPITWEMIQGKVMTVPIEMIRSWRDFSSTTIARPICVAQQRKVPTRSRRSNAWRTSSAYATIAYVSRCSTGLLHMQEEVWRAIRKLQAGKAPAGEDGILTDIGYMY